jgi:putative methionine-R-sulfoxide reductase with GAF domain
VARQLGLLERAKLEQEFDQAKERAEKLRILHSLGMAIASAMDLEQVLTRIVEAAVFITQAEEGSLLLLDEETQELNLRAQKGLGEKYARGFRIQIHDSLAGEVLQTGKPQRLTADEGTVKVVTGYLVNAILYVPVAIKGRVIGVLAVDNQSTSRPFTEDDENLLLVLAGYAAIALENARLLNESRRKFQALAAVHGIGHLDSSQPLDEEMAGLLLGDPSEPEPAAALTPQFLATVACPSLSAIADLQYLLDELAGRIPSEVEILALTQGWPVPASLVGAGEALQVLHEFVIPWAREQAGGTREKAVGLALNLLARYRPDLSDRDRISYVTRLLPALETLLSNPLEVSGLAAR